MKVCCVADILREVFLRLLFSLFFRDSSMSISTSNLRDLVFAARACQWRTRREGRERIEDDGQRFIVNINSGNTILSRRFRLSKDDSDGMPTPECFLLC